MILRQAWLSAAGFLLATSFLLANPGIVTLSDGSSFDGDVIETEDSVIVTIRGIETIIPRANVAAIEYKAEYETEFRERLARLDERDVGGRIAMSREAFDRRRYDLAREALNDALRIDPNSIEAAEILDLVQRQIRLERAADVQPRVEPGVRPALPARPGLPERRLLSADDINNIRQAELRSTDTGVRITFQGDVKRRFAQWQNIPFSEFNRLRPVQQAIRIIDHGDEEMRRQVRIATDPAALIEYKRFVQPLVLSNCATSHCHGGMGAGDFLLYAPADSDAVAYTNFYILTQYARRVEGRTPEGIFGPSARSMIERGRGDRSLLVNYGLPVTIAEHAHPEVPPDSGKPIPPIFRNRQDQRYQQVADWMNNSLVRIEPNYRIDFDIPRPTTQPVSDVTQRGDTETR